jgi:tol-pal system protein YbgF
MKYQVAAVVVVSLLSLPLLAAEAPQQSLEQRVQVLDRRVKALSELVLRMDRLQREVQQLRGEVEVQNHAMNALKQRQRDLYLDVDRRLSGSQAVDIPGAPPAPTLAVPPAPEAAPVAPPRRVATRTTPGEERAYQAAFELLTQRRYDEARQAFRTFLEKYPDGRYADNAQYWLGEASYVARDFDQALADFKQVLQRYPDSPKVPGATLKIGYIQFEKQQLVDARKTLQGLVRRYPGTSAARLAQEFQRKKRL